ncbi:MAG: MoxR family ATPase [Clostridia bacterium]|nr:MoxR family ATPase [Clostridia bacterium]
MAYNEKIRTLIDNLETTMIGKKSAAELMVTALLCGGHVLIEDVPGVGKTTLAMALAKSLGLDFKRIQFTPDVMPADITGYTMYDINEKKYVYHPGLLISNVILADEINRASPKTQSALLEAMEEKQITVDGKSYRLLEPFLILATQNPVDLTGTYPLPEAQLDRFLLKIRIGYPEKEDEARLLKMHIARKTLIDQLPRVISGEELADMQREVFGVTVHDAIIAYITEIAAASRASRDLSLGVSPRGSLALMRASQAAAYIEGRNYVTPDDVRKMLPFVLNHRVILKKEAIIAGKSAGSVMAACAASVALPTFQTK